MKTFEIEVSTNKLAKGEVTLKITFYFSYGRAGTYFDPPEDDEVDIVDIRIFHPVLKKWFPTDEGRYGKLFANERGWKDEFFDICLGLVEE